jgi:hypothetical protein
MMYGFVLPLGDARRAAEVAREAEEAGWDGFFVWEPVWGVDAWVSPAPQGVWSTCPLCGKKIKTENMAKHVAQVHTRAFGVGKN